MIIPNTYNRVQVMPAMTWLIRLFFRFIDKNGIILECNGDYPRAIKMFAEAVEYHLLMELGEDDD